MSDTKAEKSGWAGRTYISVAALSALAAAAILESPVDFVLGVLSVSGGGLLATVIAVLYAIATISETRLGQVAVLVAAGFFIKSVIALNPFGVGKVLVLVVGTMWIVTKMSEKKKRRCKI